jgi:hypothetical protein
VLGGLLFFGVLFTPIYFHNMELQNYVSELTQRAGEPATSDDVLRTRVLNKAAELGLPVKAGNVQVFRSPEGVRIDVRYFVRVDLPGYTVDLHFYPGAGSR